jgi:hypothetical protein
MSKNFNRNKVKRTEPFFSVLLKVKLSKVLIARVWLVGEQLIVRFIIISEESALVRQPIKRKVVYIKQNLLIVIFY